MSFRFS